LREIGRAFDKDHGSIQFLLAKHGGIAPAVQRRSQRALKLAEREVISRGIASGSGNAHWPVLTNRGRAENRKSSFDHLEQISPNTMPHLSRHPLRMPA
jgi:hypothetical protein